MKPISDKWNNNRNSPKCFELADFIVYFATGTHTGRVPVYPGRGYFVFRKNNPAGRKRRSRKAVKRFAAPPIVLYGPNR